MLDTLKLRIDTADRLSQAASGLTTKHALLGFDGFVDEIVRVVDKRQSQQEYSAISTLSKFSERVAEAAGKSANFELVVEKRKIGGNGPIMANALATLGVQVTYIGNLGHPTIHPAFEDFATRARIISIAEPCHTDALEFEDGKLMLGKLEPLNEITYENLQQHVGEQKLQKLFDQASLAGLVNWTMTSAMPDIWRNFLENVCPHMPEMPHRLVFFDLADPAKRLPGDILEALEWIGRFQKYFNVILGLNEKESMEIANVLGIHLKDSSPKALEELAVALRDRLQIHIVVIHPLQFACAASSAASARVGGPWDPKPLISTGAGDHFNAGFCIGSLLQLPLDACLLTGVTTSGFYVRTAKSPTIDELVHFLRNWPG
jgi:sugar/nucleoside kinase (ribokinase family)